METPSRYFFNLISIFWTPLQFIVLLLLALVCCIPSAVVIWVNAPQRKRLIVATRVWKFLSIWTIKVGLLAKFTVIDRRSANLRGNYFSALFICNHQSMFDIPVSLSVYQIAPIMKKELINVPIFGLLTKAAGAIAVDRSDKDSRRRVVEEVLRRLKTGIPVQVYPEGTRNKEADHPKKFEDIKPALLDACFKYNVVVIASSVWGTKNLLNRWGLFQLFRPIGFLVQKEFYPKDYPDAESFSRACWQSVHDGYQELENILGKNRRNI